MNIIYLSLLILIISEVVFFIIKEKRLWWSKIIFYASIFLVFAYSFYLTYSQYKLWKDDKLAKFFLPPYQDWHYFVSYSFAMFFAAILISLIIAFVVYFGFKKLNKKYSERFFYPEELYMSALAVFLVGYPGLLFYLILIILISVIGSIFESWSIKREANRFSLYYFWIPVGIFVIIASKWLMMLPLWGALKV